MHRYGILPEKLRQSSSKAIHCSVFCPGRRCRYEGGAYWQKQDMHIMGVLSTWITDDIVTMARPSTEIIKKYKIIRQFRDIGIRSLINLQERGEHSSCGVPLEESGFTYDPQIFMENKIFYYNFDWKDFGSVPKTVLLDMVKVLAFALTEGKVAIHSHAGLGRAGVLVACYLIYTLRCKPTDAVSYIRQKRPGSIQTKSQVESVQGFAQFVVPMFIVFANVIPRDSYRTNLNAYLRRQSYLLHGFEGRLLKHVPKPVFMFCERLLSLIGDNQHVSCPDLDTDQLFNDPNRFLSYFSTRCRLLRIQFSSRKFTLQLPKTTTTYMNGIAEEPRHCAPPSPPNGIIGDMDRVNDDRAFWDSPNSLSSTEDNAQHPMLNHVGGGGPPLDDGLLDFRLSDDEEQGPEPEFEYNNKSLSNTESSKDNNENFTVQDREELIDQTGQSLIPVSHEEVLECDEVIECYEVVECYEIIENPEQQIDGAHRSRTPLSRWEIVEEREELPYEDEIHAPEEEVENDDDDDPLEDLNSEECNAIIDSVLQEDPEQATPYLNGIDNKRDIFANKDNKGCSTLSFEEEFRRPLSAANIIDALLADHYVLGEDFALSLRRYQRALNNRPSAWEKVKREYDPMMLSALLWSWLDQLREPVLNINDLSVIVLRAEKPMEILKRLDNGTRYTTEYLVRFIARLQPKSTAIRTDLLRRLVASLTHQALGIQGTLRPVGMEWNKLRQGTCRQVMLFIDKLYDMAAGECAQKCHF
ncbi:protein tyrosine phosphatase domain-containing protein 1-like [Uloborus diversus]|uniref:protein tyrosine phosphatase domain-containing protein 1-like n=1 Tax=Uloborus diversus TaxID=327109 RepID=UPI00240944FC|nr:protein tyrosine phosphatase domain-containing protein 1-like [Uloborus diversus]